MAKGVEDTALYCHNALLAVNEVGADPARPCLTTTQLHAALQERRQRFSYALNATSTHDTKRGEDTRARLAVLSEIADEWRNALRHWLREGDAWKADLADEEERVVADADVDSMLYQTLIGAWPLTPPDAVFADRIRRFVTKAVREAKEHTSWRQPNEDYEQALTAFVTRLISRSQRAGLPEDIAAFARRIAPAGALNSLAQQLLKLTTPGIPDIYQGTELWAFTLVDPDNRSPIDYDERRRKLDDVASIVGNPKPQPVRDLRDHWQDGSIKLLVTSAALHFRARNRIAFELGAIEPLPAIGDQAEHVFAYGVRHEGLKAVIALPRWSAKLTTETLGIDAERWGNTTLELPRSESRAWRNVLTGEITDIASVPVRELFATLPLALLEPLGS
jgi:(1->4)-alpha-D-glucan 1-alpha-D-glucosylmutase